MKITNRILTNRELSIIQSMRWNTPRRESDFSDSGFKLNRIGGGLYRDGYQIEDTELVVKIPREREGATFHAQQEIKLWNRLLRSNLAAILPPLRYYNQAGIVVTDKILVQSESDRETQAKIVEWKESLRFPDGIVVQDLHSHNVGMYNQRFVLSDIGDVWEVNQNDMQYPTKWVEA